MSGALILGLGVFGVYMMRAEVMAGRGHPPPAEVIFGCTLLFGLGASWLCAGYFYWTQWFRLGLAATVLGILFPIVLILISEFGF